MYSPFSEGLAPAHDGVLPVLVLRVNVVVAVPYRFLCPPYVVYVEYVLHPWKYRGSHLGV